MRPKSQITQEGGWEVTKRPLCSVGVYGVTEYYERQPKIAKQHPIPSNMPSCYAVVVVKRGEELDGTPIFLNKDCGAVEIAKFVPSLNDGKGT